MPNIVNTRMLEEIEGFFKDAEDCVVVDFTGMPVAVAERIRTTFRASDIKMRVIKTSLARIAAKNLGYENADNVLDGATAVVYGGESIAQVAKAVKDVVKATKHPVIRGGLLEKKVLDARAVDQLASLPSREELLAQVLGTIIAPVTQSLGAIQSLLASVPGLTQALEEKLGSGDGGGPTE